jgi:hypothetical protein
MSAAGTAGATGATCEAGSAGLRQDHLSESKFLVFQYFKPPTQFRKRLLRLLAIKNKQIKIELKLK